MFIVQALAASYLATAVFVAVTALVGRAFGLVPEVIACGAGPAPFTLRFAGVTLRLGILAFAGYVRFEQPPHDPTGEIPQSAMERLPLWQQIIFCLSGVAALLLVAVLLMGPQAPALSLASVKALALLALSPIDNATLLRDALDMFAAKSLPEKIAAVFAVYGGINLAPLALFPAGSIIMAVLGRLAGISFDRGLGRVYFLASLALIAWIILLLAIQLVVIVAGMVALAGGIA